MIDSAAEMTQLAGQTTNKARRYSGESTTVDRWHRQIGISAVAAAVRYQGVAKNPAYAPVQTKWHDHGGDTAA
jgi:hypothetical protein